MRRRVGALGRAQFGGARARVGGNLVVIRRHRPLGQDDKTWRELRDLRLMPRSAARPGALAQEILDDAVFQRMKRHHHEPAARLQNTLRRRERQMQFVEFLVDENPQALKGSRRRVNFTRFRAHHFGDDIGQCPRRCNRRLLARRDDGPRNATRMTLFAEGVDDIGEIGLGRLRDDVRRGRAVMPHPHVERAIVAKRETAPGLIQLHRGHADVHHDAVDRREPVGRANIGEVGKSVLDQREPAGRLVDEIETARYRRPVAVDADDTGSCDFEDGPAVPASSKGGVDINAALTRVQKLDRLAAKDRDVARGRRIWGRWIHAAPPGEVRVKMRKSDAKEPIAPQKLTFRRAFRLRLAACHRISSVKEGRRCPESEVRHTLRPPL
ncbi:hypothetical protein GALL_470410 [mine drainage metagenome]|uniref:Uncharacterized protein n=1 Tax=mine drainage metagenome TaxID=410659 RepID=A0A1J5PKK8_9ZZZZ